MKLKTIYSELACFCSDIPSTYAIGSVKLQRTADGLLVYATDGKRAIRMRLDDRGMPYRKPGFEAIIPGGLWRMLCQQDAEIDELASDAKTLVVTACGVKMTIACGESVRFPPIDDVITPPANRPQTVLPRLNLTSLQEIADLLEGFASNEGFRGQLSFSDDGHPVYVHAERVEGPPTAIDVAIMSATPPSKVDRK